MATRPTYEELEQKVRALEKIAAENSFEDSETEAMDAPSSPNQYGEFNKNLKLESIIDAKTIQSLMDDFYDLTNIGIAILDLDGKVLVAKGWQDICVKFHRVHPETSKNCMESDLELSNGIEPGNFRLYRCKNNMLDMATPIAVGGHKIGNLYLGQFLFEDESVNVETFRLQAQKFGFEEDLYIEALKKVPRWSRQTVNTVMDFYTKFAGLISELGYKNLELNRSVREKESLLDKLKESENKYRELVENLNDVVYAIDNDGNIKYVSPLVETVLGYTNDQLIGRPFEQFIHPDDRVVVSEAFVDVLHNKLRPTECRIRSKSNAFRWVRTSSRPVYRNGRVTGFQGVLTDITDRKQANAEIKTLNERLAIATDSAGIGVWELDLETDTLVWDDWMYRIYGIGPKRFQGAYETWKKGVHPDDLKRADGEVQQAIKGVKPFDTQFRIVRPDGEIRHVKAFARVSRNNDGVPVKMTGVNFDITEQKSAEDALLKNESEKQAILDASIDMIMLVDAELKIIWANETAAKIIDRHPMDLIGHTCYQLFQNYDSPCPGCPTLEAFVSGKPSHKTMYQPKMKGIGESYWEDYCVPVKDESGRVMGAVEIARNVTDRHKDEKMLRASEEKFSKAFRNAPLLMSISALEDGCYLEVNEAFVRATGYSREEAIGKNSTELGLIAVEDQQKLPDLLTPEGQIKDLEVQLTCADGSKRTCLYSGETIKYEGKMRLLSIALDITHRKQREAEHEKLQAQLLQAQKMESVGRLAGGVAHDFNNNLAVIQGYTQIMLEDMNFEDSHHGELEQILNAANRSALLTRQLLAFARKQTISPKLLDLNDTVEGMLKMLRRLIGENIKLLWRPGPNLWTIKMDPAQIDQVLVNLCVNGKDAIDDVGKLTIETKNVTLDNFYCSTHPGFVPGQYAMLAVSDDGSGMDKDTLEQIFEPFFTTKEVGKGTGLGLSTIYGIVKQNDGFSNVYSEPGKGTTFKIYIPRYQGDMTQSESDRFKKTPKGHGETILLVEDDASVLNLSKMILERLGYYVLPTIRPDEAIEMARNYSDRIHLLMTDVVMPGMSGNDLAKQITQIHPDIQTLFMSGYTANVIAHQGILDEGVNFIEKPFSINDLGQKIREVLKKEKS